MNVVVHYAGRAEPANEAVTAIETAGGAAIAVQADETTVAALFEETEARFGGVDVVVDAAGIMLLAPLVDLDLSDLDRQPRRDLNLYSPHAKETPCPRPSS